MLYLLAILGGQKWQRIILTALAVLEVIFNSVSVILIFATCTPVAMLWDYTMPGTCAPIDILIDFGYLQSVFNTFVDLYLAVVPTYIFWHLNLKIGVKISLVVLMSCGLVYVSSSFLPLPILFSRASANQIEEPWQPPSPKQSNSPKSTTTR